MNKAVFLKGLKEFGEQAQIVSNSYGGANFAGLPVCSSVCSATEPGPLTMFVLSFTRRVRESVTDT